MLSQHVHKIRKGNTPFRASSSIFLYSFLISAQNLEYAVLCVFKLVTQRNTVERLLKPFGLRLTSWLHVQKKFY